MNDLEDEDRRLGPTRPLRDPARDHVHHQFQATSPDADARKMRTALILVAMVCATLVLITFACAWGWRG